MQETNHKQIINWLSDGNWHCGSEIGYMWDLRKRISELIKSGYQIEGIPCDGRCGIVHKSKTLKMRRLVSFPVLASKNAPATSFPLKVPTFSGGQEKLFALNSLPSDV